MLKYNNALNIGGSLGEPLILFSLEDYPCRLCRHQIDHHRHQHLLRLEEFLQNRHQQVQDYHPQEHRHRPQRHRHHHPHYLLPSAFAAIT